MDQDKFIKDWLEGKLDPNKLDASSDNEANEELVKGLEKIVDHTQKLEVPSDKSKAQAWDELMNTIEDEESKEIEVEEKPVKSFSIRRYVPLGVAASLLIAAVIYFLIPKTSSIISNRGEQITHVLPDGSEVKLNADSEIFYSSSNFIKNRKVQLKGEAFFEVTPGNVFIVNGEYGSIEVLGTSFNAYFRKGEIIVSCLTGKVMVKNNDSSQELNPGEITQSIDNKSLTEASSFDPEKIGSWRSGEFYYDQTPLSEVILELERQFNIEVQYSSAENRIYNGYFNNADLNEALQLVLKPMSLDYSLEGNKVIVK